MVRRVRADAPYPMAGMAHYAAGHSLPVPYGYFPQGAPHTQAAGSPTMVRVPRKPSAVSPTEAVAARWLMVPGPSRKQNLA